MYIDLRMCLKPEVTEEEARELVTAVIEQLSDCSDFPGADMRQRIGSMFYSVQEGDGADAILNPLG